MADCAVMVREAGHYLHRPARPGDTLCWPDGTQMLAHDVPDWDEITGKPLVFPPSTHTHAYSALTGIPATFAPAAHTHPQSEVTNLVADLANRSLVGHTHALADVTGLVAALAGKSDVGHTHAGLPIYAFATGDQTTTGTAGVNITGLGFTVAANTRYMGTLQFLYQSNNILAGPAIGATGPTMSEAFTATVHAPGSTSLGGLLANVGGLLSLTTTDQVNVDRPLTVHFKFRVGGTGGTLQFQFARGGLAGQTITSRASSTAQLFLAA